jgi:hypothetical protein
MIQLSQQLLVLFTGATATRFEWALPMALTLNLHLAAHPLLADFAEAKAFGVQQRQAPLLAPLDWVQTRISLIMSLSLQLQTHGTIHKAQIISWVLLLRNKIKVAILGWSRMMFGLSQLLRSNKLFLALVDI